MQNYMTNFGQIVPPFAAGFPGVFADVEAPGDSSGKHWEFVQDAVY